MAQSYTEVVSDGTLVLLDLSFDYFSRDEIRVSFDGVTTVSGWAWVGTTQKTISFSPAVANGVVVRVQRITDVSEPLHIFDTGAQFNATSMDENFAQITRGIQEMQEGVYPQQSFGEDIDMNGFRITNLGVAVADSDAARKDYVDDLRDYVNEVTPSTVAQHREVQIATAGQAVFTIANTLYNPVGNSLRVLLNGLYQENLEAFSSSGAVVTFAEPLDEGTEVTFLFNSPNSFAQDVAADIPFTPAGGLLSTNVQAALAEVGTKVATAISDFAAYVASLASSAGSSLVGFLQSGTGATARTLQDKSRDVVSVADFGVSTTNSGAVNATRMQVALDACAASGACLEGVPGTYALAGSLVIQCHCDLSTMHFTVDAVAVPNPIRVGPNVAGQYLFDKEIALPFVTNTAKVGAGWTGFESSVGVELANVYQSRINIPYVYNFGVGVTCGGYGVGTVYNNIVIGILFGNKKNLQLLPKTTTGWCNQNVFTIGRLGHSSSEGTAVAGVCHIELRNQVGGVTAAPNNNLFVNPSIEGNEAAFHLDIQGTFNTFVNPRFEVGTAIPARVNFHAVTANETAGNNLIGGYDGGDITYTFSGAGSSTKNKRIGGTANDSYEFSGNGINLVNKSGSARTAPHIQGFLSSATALGKTQASTDWVYRLHGDGLSVKSSGDTQDRIQLTAAGYLALGRGSSAPFLALRAGTTGQINSQTTIEPETDLSPALGSSSKRWANTFSNVLTLVDGVTAPGTVTGHASLYVDSADGDLKIKFSDGVVKTIVVDV